MISLAYRSRSRTANASLPRSAVRCAASAVALSAWAGICLAGCGGGDHGRPTGDVAGAVSDAQGRPVVGAIVGFGDNTTTTLTDGSFALHDVPRGYELLQASATVNGHGWSGETAVDVSAFTLNRNVNVVVSDTSTQGGITGTITGPDGGPLSGAKVFVAGPYGSTLAISDDGGNYTAPMLPSGTTYQVTCSLAGFTNASKSVAVSAGQPFATASFALASGAASTIPPPTNLSSIAMTVADTASRAGRGGPNVYDWLRDFYRAQRGLPRPVPPRSVRRLGATRDTPAGSAIEIDLFWTPPTGAGGQPLANLFGYAVTRAAAAAALPSTQPGALLRDPLATSYFDLDPALTPGISYYYAVESLDTIGFPNSGAIGAQSGATSATPLPPAIATAPPDGATAPSATPLFQWQPISGAAAYQVIVWDRFPTVFPTTTPDPTGSATTPIWPADLRNPGASVAAGGNASSVTYQGPPLQSGHTYYWLVVATNSAAPSGVTALSASPLARFVAP